MVDRRPSRLFRIALPWAAAAVIATAISPASWARVPAPSPLTLAALAWSVSSVDARSGTATANLTWTVADTAKRAHNVLGELVVGVPRSKPGRFASLVFTVNFALRGTPQVKGSGTARKSSYRYAFQVPEFAQVSPAKWQVVAFRVRDDQRNRLSLSATRLGGFHATLAAKELVDTQPPSDANLNLVPNFGAVGRPYVYVTRRHAGFATYAFNGLDNRAGLSSASMRLAGPGGKAIDVNVPVSRLPDQYQCGLGMGNDFTNMECIITVTFPARTPLGRWVVSTLRLTDEAGNTAVLRDLSALPVTATSNQVVRASAFKANPNPVNNWSAQHPYTIRFSMEVSGARGGVAAIHLDTLTNNQAMCDQTRTKPVMKGNVATVTLRVDWMLEICQITGIAVVDGRGDVAVYGLEYGAPDPDYLIRQVPNASAPKAASASISPTSAKSSSTTTLTLTINLKPGYAPTDGMSMTVYDSSGNFVTGITGGAFDDNGVVTNSVTLPANLGPGKYSVGFSITNAAQMTTTYGPGGEPVPGGPLILTVTSG